jgi:pimeloyl-ACP methyl ester carboxylesterase
MIAANDVSLETFRASDGLGDDAIIISAHPADAFTEDTAHLLAAQAGAPVVCINPAGIGGSTGALRPTLESIVDDLEAARRALAEGASARFVFWGLSGGGWLGQLWAKRYPDALAGLIVESACPCFRARLADPTCALSPFFPAWQTPLEAAGLLDPRSHDGPLPVDAETTWVEIAHAGSVFRRSDGPALLVSPMPQSPAMLHMMPALYRFDARGFLGDLRIPTLVIAGDADPVVPLAHARAIHQAIPGATFVSIPGGGHVPTAQRHPAIAPAVRAFLAR